MAGEEDFVFGVFYLAMNGADFDAVVYEMKSGQDVATYLRIPFAVDIFGVTVELKTGRGEGDEKRDGGD